MTDLLQVLDHVSFGLLARRMVTYVGYFTISGFQREHFLDPEPEMASATFRA